MLIKHFAFLFWPNLYNVVIYMNIFYRGVKSYQNINLPYILFWKIDYP